MDARRMKELKFDESPGRIAKAKTAMRLFRSSESPVPFSGVV